MVFILSLRGRFGAIIAVQLNLLSIALTIVLLRSSMLGLQLAAVAAFLAGSLLTLAHMDRNKEKLTFNSEESREDAYPSAAKNQRWLAWFKWSQAIFFFFGGLFLSLSGVKVNSPPTGLTATAFFFGCFAVIDIIHRLIRKRDR